MFQELIDMNPRFDSLALQFYIKRKLSDGTIARVGKTDATYCLSGRMEAV